MAPKSARSKGTKRTSKGKLETLICKKKLDALEREESLTKDDRFNLAEKKILLEAFDNEGLQVFQDTKKLHKYFPNRKESDLRGLLDRLKIVCQSRERAQNPQQPSQTFVLDDWIRLCQQLVSSFARDKKVNLDDALADSMLELANEMTQTDVEGASDNCSNDLTPNYPKLLEYLAQLLMGKFPDKPSTANAQLSMKLFEHLNEFVESFDCSQPLQSLISGEWLKGVQEELCSTQELALKGLDKIDGKIKKCPTVKDIKVDEEIEALCLELPKIKRITDMLNPLHVEESLVKNLMSMFNETPT